MAVFPRPLALHLPLGFTRVVMVTTPPEMGAMVTILERLGRDSVRCRSMLAATATLLYTRHYRHLPGTMCLRKW